MPRVDGSFEAALSQNEKCAEAETLAGAVEMSEEIIEYE